MTTRRQNPGRTQTWLFKALPVLTFAAVLAVWELCCWLFALPPYLLPAPSAIVTAGLDVSVARWAAHIGTTLAVALGGFCLALVVSLPMAMAIVSSRWIERGLYPLLIVVQSIPVVAIAPILLVMLGPGIVARTVITFLIAFFPIVVSTVTGMASVPDDLLELSRSLRAPNRRLLREIRLPFAVGHLFAALRVSSTLAVIGTVVAEFISSDQGLGYLIFYSTSNFRIPLAFAALAVLVILSLIFFRAIVLIQRLLFPWSMATTD